MEEILKQFATAPLFDACASLLRHLHISFAEVTREPVSFADLYQQPLTKTLAEAMKKVAASYYIGNVDESTLGGQSAQGKTVGEVEQATVDGRYQGMLAFAIDVREGASLTRTESTTLTRGFNHIAAFQPVVLIIRQGDHLSLATCERMNYRQEWRQGEGERLGKVSILRGISCLHPHRGHVDILESLGDKSYDTFETLYQHWMKVFSNQLLTEKFYGELSDWYAWAITVAKFPNDLSTTDDDQKYNSEACIRLITRLIFVWFLKQKRLIPEEFFDETYIHNNLIENFNPHDHAQLFYNPEKSKYYRLILQNLFFAMLNCPIVAEGGDVANNRRFRKQGTFHGANAQFDINNVMRYEAEFMDGGAEKFLALANTSVPFLNGGLFDCLDNKREDLYYDGFSERKASLEQLHVPDYLFFGDEVGNDIDLSEWYGDAKKKHVKARGLVDIMKRYCFTVEENTPYDQEVSLDPELLGKAFENLLAAYNPETKTSARKQTGSFYTPREIVQYMVNESLVAHLKRICGEEQEAQYRQLLGYGADEPDLTMEQRKAIMNALYNCRILDPACGSGAFPMGILQQMVHVLKRIDPTNEMWKQMMIDLAINEAKTEMEDATLVEQNRQARLADIEEAFNRSVNDPDYARKLYLIEHCIYGVDIQPIATQISKLRFFISLVVDQKPTTDPKTNFGIRPLPNLEAKFVTANTLIPVTYDGSLVEEVQEVRDLKKALKQLNHRIFLTRRSDEKKRLKANLQATRIALANAIEATGFVSHGDALQLASWDMFDQNASASFFDPDWMFDVRNGFDIVIANPPYLPSKEISSSDKAVYKRLFSTAEKQFDLFSLFIEKGLALTANTGISSYIVPDSLIGRSNFIKAREIILLDNTITKWVHLNKVFDNAIVASLVYVCQKVKTENYEFDYIKAEDVPNWVANKYNTIPINSHAVKHDSEKKVYFANTTKLGLREKLAAVTTFGNKCILWRGEEIGKQADFILEQKVPNSFPLITGKEARRYETPIASKWIGVENVQKSVEKYSRTKILIRQVGDCINATIDDKRGVTTQSVYALFPANDDEFIHLYTLLGVLNSRLFDFFYRLVSGDKQLFKRIILENIKALPYPDLKSPFVARLDELVKWRYSVSEPEQSKVEQAIDLLVYHLYDLTYDEVLVIDPDTPFTREEYAQCGK